MEASTATMMKMGIFPQRGEKYEYVQACTYVGTYLYYLTCLIGHQIIFLSVPADSLERARRRLVSPLLSPDYSSSAGYHQHQRRFE